MGIRPEEQWDGLCGFIVEKMEQWGIPGLALGIQVEGTQLSRGFGVTNVDHPLAVDEATLFQIGSITKTFTATAILKLAECGRFALDATVQTYLPDFRVADETASSLAKIRHLLTHVGGWAGDFFLDTGSGDDALVTYVADMADLDQIAPVGCVWSYNNAVFCVAGRVIEVVTGTTYEAALKELVLEPLGLESCCFDPADVMIHRFAVGHQVTDEVARPARPWRLPRGVYPAGGIACHVQDLLKYARFHMTDGRTEGGARCLSPGSMSIMHSPQVTRWAQKESLGLAWWLEELEGTHIHSHGGGTNGQVSLLLMAPEREFAIAMVTNADHGGKLIEDVRRWALQHYLDIDQAEPLPIESSEGDLAHYAGRYLHPFSEI